jgi:hypothetical protein
MPTEVQPPLAGDLTAFTARLDELRADQNSNDLSDALWATFKQRELYNSYISSLAGDTERAKGLLEVFDKVRSATCTISWIGSQYLCAVQALQTTTYGVTIFEQFRELCGRTGLLPVSHIIPGRLIRMTEHPVAPGNFGDVHEGIYNDKRVAVKALRVYKEDDMWEVKKVTRPAFPIPLTPPVNYHHQVFCKEAVMWRKISHPNIVQFLGVSEALAPLCMVSEWMPNGNVRNYVAKNPETSRLQLVC